MNSTHNQIVRIGDIRVYQDPKSNWDHKHIEIITHYNDDYWKAQLVHDGGQQVIRAVHVDNMQELIRRSVESVFNNEDIKVGDTRLTHTPHEPNIHDRPVLVLAKDTDHLHDRHYWVKFVDTGKQHFQPFNADFLLQLLGREDD